MGHNRRMPRRSGDEWLLQVGVDLERFMNDTGLGAPILARQRGWGPRVDMLETETHVLVRFELAGVRRDQFQLTFRPARNVLSIHGVRRDEHSEQENPRAHLLEIEHGEFARDLVLPEVELAFAETRTHFYNGLLLVAIPKSGTLIVEHTVTIREV